MAKRKPGHRVNQKGRSRNERFIKLDHGLLRSAAWKDLDPYAVKLLIAIWSRHSGDNNGNIPFSVREACELLGCGHNRARACFAELEDKGFLRLVRRSSFTLKTREAREWAITAERIGDDPPTRDFKHWPEKQNTVSHSDTDGARDRHRDPNSVTNIQVNGVPDRHRDPPDGPPHGVSVGHTSNIPRRGRDA